MKAFAWHAARALERLSWPAWIGVAFLVGALGVAVVTARGIVAERHAAIEALQKLGSPNRSGVGPRAAGGTGATELDTFYAYFPPLSTRNDSLERVHAIAEANGIALARAEYKLADDRGSRLARYQMTLPVSGTYQQIRSFVAQVLAELPAAAVDEVAFTRDAIGARSLETRVRLTLFLRRD